VVHAWNPSIGEDKAGGSKIPQEPGVHNKTLSQNKNAEHLKDLKSWKDSHDY
jgi:hypothetical protein